MLMQKQACTVSLPALIIVYFNALPCVYNLLNIEYNNHLCNDYKAP